MFKILKMFVKMFVTTINVQFFFLLKKKIMKMFMVIDLYICHNFRLCWGLGPRDPLAVLTVERQTTLPWVGHVAGFHSDR